MSIDSLRIAICTVLALSLGIEGCAYSLSTGSSSRYDQVITIDARDGISDDEYAQYHELPKDQLVTNRLVKILLNPHKNSFDLGFLEVTESSIIRKLTQTIHVHFIPNSPIRKDMTFNNILVSSSKLRSIELALTIQ
jgi:hypothetical protein